MPRCNGDISLCCRDGGHNTKCSVGQVVRGLHFHIPSPSLYAVMPLDVLGRTRATLTGPASTPPWPKGLGNLVKPCRAGDRALQLLLFNEECLVSASHQLALTTSLPFVHTARRYYRLNGSVRPWDWLREVGNDHSEPETWSNLVI